MPGLHAVCYYDHGYSGSYIMQKTSTATQTVLLIVAPCIWADDVLGILHRPHSVLSLDDLK